LPLFNQFCYSDPQSNIWRVIDKFSPPAPPSAALKKHFPQFRCVSPLARTIRMCARVAHMCARAYTRSESGECGALRVILRFLPLPSPLPPPPNGGQRDIRIRFSPFVSSRPPLFSAVSVLGTLSYIVARGPFGGSSGTRVCVWGFFFSCSGPPGRQRRNPFPLHFTSFAVISPLRAAYAPAVA
jgi:hypothetical protein